MDAGATCLDLRRVIGHVRMWLGADRVERDVTVRVQGDTRDRHALWVDVVRGQERSRRSFAAAPEDCDDLHAIVGLAIALALDVQQAQRALPAAQHEQPAFVVVSLQPSAAYDVLPDDSFGAVIGVEVSWLPWLSLRADVLSHASWQDTIVGSRGRFNAALLAGSILVCAGGRPDRRLRIGLCVGPAAGAVHAWGSDYAPSRSDTGPWLALRSGVRAQLSLGIEWLIDADVLAAIESPSFEVERADTPIARAASTSGFMLALGPALVF